MTTGSAECACLEIESDELWSRIGLASPRADVGADPDMPFFDDDGSSERRLSQSDRRRTFIALYAWAVPTREAIDAIAVFVGQERVLEVCAGSGLWARLLSDADVSVIATGGCAPDAPPFVPIEVIEAEAAVYAHPECGALFLCWPPFRQDCAYRALQAFEGERLVYVGDARFTGDRQFHTILQQWTLVDRLQIPAWPGLDDHVYLYTRAESFKGDLT